VTENSGVLVWKNWKNSEQELAPHTTSEFRLYSDAHLTGELECGPYALVNTVPDRSPADPHEIVPCLVVRVDWCGQPSWPDMSTTVNDGYHGGYLPDEIAALISLAAGIKAEAGPIDRVYNRNEMGGIINPFGYPRTHSHAFLPFLPRSGNNPIIPWLKRTLQLSEMSSLLHDFPKLEARTATALVTSARQFQKACWLSDTDPNTSWLLFISSLETAAQHLDAESGLSIDKLDAVYPKLTKILRANLKSEELDLVAKELRKITGATAKFVKFCSTYCAPPPDKRPSHSRISYERKEMDVALKKIYSHRSSALHGGISFPRPICCPPSREGGEQETPDERPSGLGFGTSNNSWLPAECPMYLHTFAHIARQTLLLWWQDAATKSKPDTV